MIVRSDVARLISYTPASRASTAITLSGPLAILTIFSILLVDNPAGSTKDLQMSDVLELALTGEMLRTAIRAKLRMGANRRDISVLINAYAPQGASTKRTDGGVYRIPVELIPLDRRVAFLDALNELPIPLSVVATTIAPAAA